MQRADWINLGHHHLRPGTTKRLRTAFADIAVAADNADLAGDHHIGRALDAVEERFTAAVKVVELRLRHGVVDVDRRDEKRTSFGHLIEPVDTGGRFL